MSIYSVLIGVSFLLAGLYVGGFVILHIQNLSPQMRKVLTLIIFVLAIILAILIFILVSGHTEVNTAYFFVGISIQSAVGLRSNYTKTD